MYTIINKTFRFFFIIALLFPVSILFFISWYLLSPLSIIFFLIMDDNAYEFKSDIKELYFDMPCEWFEVLIDNLFDIFQK